MSHRGEGRACTIPGSLSLVDPLDASPSTLWRRCYTVGGWGETGAGIRLSERDRRARGTTRQVPDGRPGRLLVNAIAQVGGGRTAPRLVVEAPGAAYDPRVEMGETLRPHREGTAISVWVVPGARRQSVGGLHAGALRIRVTAPPERGRANQAVAKLLRVTFGVPARLERGAGSRRKRFILEGLTPNEAAAILEIVLNG